jgi:hypothetical protein
VPGAVEVIDFFFGQSSDVELTYQIVQDEPVQTVDVGPGDLAAAHALHCGLVATSPSIGKCHPIHVDAFALPEQLSLSDDGATPVHHGAEDVEDQGVCRSAHIGLRRGHRIAC